MMVSVHKVIGWKMDKPTANLADSGSFESPKADSNP
jgi:hypothetical protein